MFELQYNSNGSNGEDHFEIGRTPSCLAVSGWSAIAGQGASTAGRHAADAATPTTSEISESTSFIRAV